MLIGFQPAVILQIDRQPATGIEDSMGKRHPAEIAAARTASERFEVMTIQELRPLAKLLSTPVSTRKWELVPLLVATLTDPVKVRELYEKLDPMSQKAIQLAVSDPEGRYDWDKFFARYGTNPTGNIDEENFKKKLYAADLSSATSMPLRLFFPKSDSLPTDTREILRQIVPPLEAFVTRSIDALPETYLTYIDDDDEPSSETSNWKQPIRVRETAEAALTDFQSVLRMIENGGFRVKEKKGTPVEDTQYAVAELLTGGEFYSHKQVEEEASDPAHNLHIRSFAWPMLLQAAGLCEKNRNCLKLTSAGKSALTVPPLEVVRKLWESWQNACDFDEFNRIEVILGQGRAKMSDVVGRRAVIVEALSACPPGKWLAVHEFYRLIRAMGREFVVTKYTYDLYISDPKYGRIGYSEDFEWGIFQGRYILAFLFEYAATLGVIDVAYVQPQGARDDFRNAWGTDDLSCLSRYDGLLYLRVNPLGAWLLGLVENCQVAAPGRGETLRVLANHDIVADRELPSADSLVLDRFTEQSSDRVWKLSPTKILGVVEKGGSISELEQFLESRCIGTLPETVVRLLSDLKVKASLLANGGAALLIECANEHIAAELAADRQLKGKCLRAGEKCVAIREADISAVRKVIRKLGYVWPITEE